MDIGIVGDRHFGDMAGDLGGDERHVGADIGVVGGHEEAPVDEPIIALHPAIADGGQK